ncbi:MAG: ABC transporter ATP-binding protein [Chthoniobacterales bacterium]|nr:MAG: ABC transporter ATP-binding protein [Chthoniobacterales bacterium]
MTEPAIRLAGVSKVFPVPLRRRVVVALRDLNLEVATGEVYGLLGPNGSGKSTTLKIILGLIAPTRGTVGIFGRDNSAVATRSDIGFLPENAYFHKFLTGAETLRFHARLCGLGRRETDARIDELLETVDLTRARDARLGTYSKGMLQRIGLAQALVHRPKLLVLDEPTAAIDPAGSRDIQNLIASLKQRGVTVLLSSHLLTQVQEVCDRVGILHRGTLLREGRVEDLLAIENQTELVLENASPDLLDALEARVASSDARVVARRQAQTSLEQLFLKVTESREE